MRFSIMQLTGRKLQLNCQFDQVFALLKNSHLILYLLLHSYQKSEEARGRPKVDYTQLKLKDAILVVTWAVFVTPFLGRCAYLIAATDAGWAITVDDIFNF